MDYTRLIQCQGNDPTYIKHLELRIIELESTCSSRYPETSGVQQQISGQHRPCEICRDPNLSTQDIDASQEISADSIRLASESCHDNQSIQHSNRPPGSTFAFIPYEPPVTTEPLVTTDSSALTDSARQQWNHLDSLASSLSDIPKTSRWKVWTSTNDDRRKNIVLSLVSGLVFPNDDNPIAHELSAPISILLEYSKSMEPAEPRCASANSEEKRQFIYFQELIFCSMCAVALEFTPTEVVFAVMRSVFQSDAKSKTLRARIYGAKWANRAIYLLSRTRLGSCSWDLIYIVSAANNHVNFYRKFNDYSIKPDDLIPKLKIPEDTQTISVPLAIPSIIRTIFRDLVPLEKICECLGYELGDYNRLDLSSLEKRLVMPANTNANDTEPNHAEPIHTTPIHTTPIHTTPIHTTPIHTTPIHTTPIHTTPIHTTPIHTTPIHTTPNKKRKNGSPETSSKRQCWAVSSDSPEGRIP
ncbi:uncharacterized protein N7479_001766 [Penicillium vulpinum]|uniref:uncharacterized protein n=1 Tax=Penicillium vulpinum TaxID=29845 RepID=UPI002548B494|nr:uncharacterized protein N7479_001766 [Penicillium vulpinum]KAJ5971848.1 hypothetical protein N7479_001766 [Penicillium vulpinum]